MNISTILRSLFVIVLAGYVSLATGDETAREQYTVKISDIPMSRDTADSLLRYVVGKNNGAGIVAHDNVKNTDIILSIIEKNTDVRIEDVFVAKIMKLYNDCLDENTTPVFTSEERKCVLYKREDGSRINMCIDKKDKTIITLGIIE